MKKMLLTFSVAALALTACNDKLVQEAKKTDQNNALATEEKKRDQEDLEKKQEEILKELEKPIDEVISNNELDQVDLLSLSNFQVKDSYENPSELAIHAGETLFRFYKGDMDPEEFYQFLMKYGSESMRADLQDKENSILIFENVQSLYREKNPGIDSFVITTPILSGTKKEAYFYRKVVSKTSEEFNISTLVLEDGAWKFKEDSPSPPFEISKEEELINTEEEQKNDE